MAYEKAQAQCHEYEVKLKQAEEKQDEVEIIIQQEKLAEAKAKLAFIGIIFSRHFRFVLHAQKR